MKFDAHIENVPPPTLASLVAIACQFPRSLAPVISAGDLAMTPETIGPLLDEVERELVEHLAALFVVMSELSNDYAAEAILSLTRREVRAGRREPRGPDHEHANT